MIDLEDRLIAACDAAGDVHALDPMGRCPFGALLGDESPYARPDSKLVSLALGLSAADVEAFMSGFDDIDWPLLGPYDSEMLAMGKRFRDRYP